MEENEVLSKAISIYGLCNQLDMLTEETGELMQSVNKVKRMGGMIESNTKIKYPDKHSTVKYCLAYFNLCSEVADAKIMIAQLELMLSSEAINISKERKIARLNDNLTKSNIPK